MDKNIYVPKYLREGIKKNDPRFPERINVYGADCETKPFLFFGIGNSDKVYIKECRKKDIHKVFLKKADEITKKNHVNIISFHNAQFDLEVIFLKFKEHFLENDVYIYFDLNFNEISKAVYDLGGGIEVNIKNSKSVFGVIRFSKNRKLLIIDSFAFFKSSLSNLTKTLALPHKKEDGWSENYSKTELRKYLKNDVLCQYDLISFIIGLHKEYDIKICVSIAQMAARIFRHFFLDKDDVLTFPPMQAVIPAELSYHGGKTIYYMDKVELVKDVYEYDINSQYPYAMSQVPNFLFCDYIFVNEYNKGDVGIFCVSGYVKKDKYPIFYTHDFRKITKGKITDLWVTSYEIEKAIKYGAVTIYKSFGYVVCENKEAHHNPLRDFVNHFYELKSNTDKKTPKYLFYKTILNSLYGKFVQHIDHSKRIQYYYEDGSLKCDKITQYKAGGLYNPFIASLITGYARAQIYEYEQKYQSMHTATDSIKTSMPLPEDELTGKLGSMSYVCRGDCIFFRSKCYIHFKGDMKDNIIEKYALHGFHQNVDKLLDIYNTKNTKYNYKRMCKIKESIKRTNKKIIPCDFNEFSAELKIKWE